MRAEFEITDRCNLNCLWCYFPCTTSNSIHMDINFFKKAVNTMAKIGIDEVHISGGEPLFHPKLLEFLEFVTKHSKIHKIVLETNGILLSNHIIVSLSNMPKLLLRVSVPGYTSYCRLTGKDLVHLVLKNICNAIKQGGKVEVNFVLSKYNKDDLISTFEEVSKCHVHFFRITPVKGAPPSFSLDKNEIQKRFSLLTKHYRQFGIPKIYVAPKTPERRIFVSPSGQLRWDPFNFEDTFSLDGLDQINREV